MKDWKPTRTVGHLAAYGGDRFITGDRIAHLPVAVMKDKLANWLGDDPMIEARVPPRRDKIT